jgi:hypothetical protein
MIARGFILLGLRASGVRTGFGSLCEDDALLAFVKGERGRELRCTESIPSHLRFPVERRQYERKSKDLRSYFDFLHCGHDENGFPDKASRVQLSLATNHRTNTANIVLSTLTPTPIYSVSINCRSFSIHSLSCDWQVLSHYSNSSEHYIYPLTTVSSPSRTICCYVWRSSLEARNRARSQGLYIFLGKPPLPPRLTVSDASTVRLCRHSRVHRQWSRNAYEVCVVYYHSSAAFHRASPIELGLHTDMASYSDN